MRETQYISPLFANIHPKKRKETEQEEAQKKNDDARTKKTAYSHTAPDLPENAKINIRTCPPSSPCMAYVWE